ncbi:MAG TPA: glycoside hydrolase family 2 TIM barrel-domain containing protein, partial [Roseiflexaceae bacterium]|nr:glycoside hydrolase family 2 TIM barrel-domain containing protein [Roseiflexaceae bacterium]
DDLATVCDIAAEHGLKLDITFFTGHMSGPNWSPGWLLEGAPKDNALQLVSGGQVVESGYRNPYTDAEALTAERLLIGTVVNRLREHPAVGIWNLGNEPDLFAEPPDERVGEAWVREMTELIYGLDPQHPVTCGLHQASLQRNNGLRIDQVFGATDLAVMHAYPMYLHWARSPLDPELVPFTCALTTALCGKPTLMEEFGGCTVAPGEPSQVWSWTAYGKPRTQFMASEEDMAAYLAEVLPRLVDVGATGAVLWCFADYVPELWDKPPCGESRHERFFGLVRPDGSPKPHAEVIREFAATRPTVLTEPRRAVTLTITPDEFYQDPIGHTIALYQQFVEQAGE